MLRGLRYLSNAYIGRKAPLSMVHFLTERCNARCPHCFIDFARPVSDQDALSLAEIERLTRHMGAGLYNINLTGGEPFLRDDVYPIVGAYFANTTVRSIVITTNGTQSGRIRDFVAHLSRTRFAGRVKLSLSIDNREQEHDGARGVPGAYRAALETYRMIERCGDTRVTADIALTVTPFNRAVIADVYEELRRQGIRRFTPILMREQGVVRQLSDQREVRHAYDRLARRIERDQRLSSYPLRHRLSEVIRGAKNAVLRELLHDSRPSPDGAIRCRAGSLFGVIGADGSVFPCEVLDATWRIGNLREAGMDFMKLWRGKAAAEARERLRRSPCRCSYECAWSVTIPTTPSLLPRLILHAGKQLLWNRNA